MQNALRIRPILDSEGGGATGGMEGSTALAQTSRQVRCPQDLGFAPLAVAAKWLSLSRQFSVTQDADRPQADPPAAPPPAPPPVTPLALDTRPQENPFDLRADLPLLCRLRPGSGVGTHERETTTQAQWTYCF